MIKEKIINNKKEVSFEKTFFLKKINFQTIVEVIDARAIKSTFIVNKLISLFPNLKIKNRYFLITKKDLSDECINKKWSSFLRKKNIFFSITNLKDPLEVKKLKKKFFNFLKNIRNLKKPTKLLVIGYQNVGKSTFINVLKQKKTVNVGNEPGITKGYQLIKLLEKVYIFDTPGIIEKSYAHKEFNEGDEQRIIYHQILIKSLKQEELFFQCGKYLYDKFLVKKYKWLLSLILKKIKKNNKEEKINFEKFILLWAEYYNFKKRNNFLDEERANKHFLLFFQKGKIGKISFEEPCNCKICLTL